MYSRFSYHLKYFLSTALAAILFGGAEPFRQFCRGHYEEREIILNLDQWLRRRCLLKIFLIYSSGKAEPFGRGHYEEYFCETILNLDQ